MPRPGNKLPHEFPHESVIQQAVENHFCQLGFEMLPAGHADLHCRHPQTGEAWLIEAKGKTSAIGLDFRTCLGQLLQRIEDAGTRHGVAVPDLAPFLAQCSEVAEWVREALGLHWLLVSESGEVRIIAPGQPIGSS